jgi:hypothetical protein
VLRTFEKLCMYVCLESEKEVNLCQTLKLSFAAVKYQCCCALLPYGREMCTESGNKLLTIREKSGDCRKCCSIDSLFQIHFKSCVTMF